MDVFDGVDCSEGLKEQCDVALEQFQWFFGILPATTEDMKKEARHLIDSLHRLYRPPAFLPPSTFPNFKVRFPPAAGRSRSQCVPLANTEAAASVDRRDAAVEFPGLQHGGQLQLDSVCIFRMPPLEETKKTKGFARQELEFQFDVFDIENFPKELDVTVDFTFRYNSRQKGKAKNSNNNVVDGDNNPDDNNNNNNNNNNINDSDIIVNNNKSNKKNAITVVTESIVFRKSACATQPNTVVGTKKVDFPSDATSVVVRIKRQSAFTSDAKVSKFAALHVMLYAQSTFKTYVAKRTEWKLEDLQHQHFSFDMKVLDADAI